MWFCNECFSKFDEPSIKSYWENLDGENGWQRLHEAHCPYCGSEQVEAMREIDDDLFAPEPEWVRERREREELHD